MQERTERKTKNQTRRIVNPQPLDIVCSTIIDNKLLFETRDENDTLILIKPRYNVGEIVAIAQAYKDILETLPEPYRRKSDGSISTEISESIGFRNKLYVKPILMPLQIKILGVRAERLQDISNEDCIKEGIVFDGSVYSNGLDGIQYLEPRAAYKALINSIDGKETWDNNSWVWVYDYELIDRKEVQL